MAQNNAERANFVDNMRSALIQRTSNVMAIVDELGAMVHPEAYAVIFAERTHQAKMRELYERVLQPGGEAVKAAFYDVFGKHEPFLLKDLIQNG